MKHYVGLDTSVKTTSICILDQEGSIVCEDKAITRPDDLVVPFPIMVELHQRRNCPAMRHCPQICPGYPDLKFRRPTFRGWSSIVFAYYLLLSRI